MTDVVVIEVVNSAVDEMDEFYGLSWNGWAGMEWRSESIDGAFE